MDNLEYLDRKIANIESYINTNKIPHHELIKLKYKLDNMYLRRDYITESMNNTKTTLDSKEYIKQYMQFLKITFLAIFIFLLLYTYLLYFIE